MKINQMVVSIFIMIFGLVTLGLAILSLLDYVSLDIVMIFMGLSQVLLGLNQINMAQQVNSKGRRKGNKYVGAFSITVGIVLIILSTKMILG